MDGSVDFPLTSAPLGVARSPHGRRRPPRLIIIKRHHGNRALGLVLLGFILGAAAAIALMLHAQAPVVQAPAAFRAPTAPVVPAPRVWAAAQPPGPVVPPAKTRGPLPTPSAAKPRTQAPISAQTEEDAAAAGMTSRRPKTAAVQADQLF